MIAVTIATGACSAYSVLKYEFTNGRPIPSGLRLTKRHPVWPVAVEKTAPMRFWAGEQSTARPWDMRMGAATVVAAAIKSETSSVSELPHSLPCSITQNPLLGSP